MPAIEEHVTNEAFDSAKDGLDFLEVSGSQDTDGLCSFTITHTLLYRSKIVCCCRT